jgi:hypothetical protein
MTILFAANEFESFTTIGGTVDSSATENDADFQRAQILVLSGTSSDGVTNPRNGAVAVLDGAQPTDVWIHFVTTFPPLGSSTDRQFFECRDEVNDLGIFRFDQENGSLEFEVNVSGSYVNQGVSFGLPSDSEMQVDVHLVINGDGTGTIDVFFDKISIANYSGNIDSSIAGLGALLFTSVRPGGNETTNGQGFRELIVADEQTTEMRVATLEITGAGTENTWSGGAVTDINAVTLDDLAVLASDTAGQRAAFTLGDLTATAQGLTPLAVCVGARGRNSGGGPTGVQMGLKTGSGDVLNAAQTLGAGFGRHYEVYETNLATALEWTIADINGMELLLVSAA